MFRLNHVNINITDMEKSLLFYKKAFGLEEKRRKIAQNGEFIIVFLTDGSSDLSLELTWLRDKAGKYNLGDNETHICFAADDFDSAYAHHREMGIICYENTKMGVYFVEDPDGYWFEIKR